MLSHSTPATLHARFEQQAELRSRAVAVESDGMWLTYRELNQEANRLARRLSEEGVGPDELVVVDVDRGCDLVIGLLAVLKTGAAFVLVEDAPAGVHRDTWIRSTGAQVLLSDFHSGFEGQGLRAVGIYEASGTDQNPGVPVLAKNWACVAGHYGWTHESALQRLDWASEVLNLREMERVLSCVSLEGEAVLELFLPLITGATLVLATTQELENSERLDWLALNADCRTLRMPRRLAATA
jgi:non-ribosomal peptide synthetase component F